MGLFSIASTILFIGLGTFLIDKLRGYLGLAERLLEVRSRKYRSQMLHNSIDEYSFVQDSNCVDCLKRYAKPVVFIVMIAALTALKVVCVYHPKDHYRVLIGLLAGIQILFIILFLFYMIKL